MKVLFALVLFTHVYSGGAIVTRIGIYETKANCEIQLRRIIPKVWSANGSRDQLICLPTNG